MTISHAARLQEWLRTHRINVGPAGRWLFEAPDHPEARVAALRLLNELESRFDDLIVATTGDASVDWDAVRQELALLPGERSPWLSLTEQIQVRFAAQRYAERHIRRAERLWRDFIVVQDDRISVLLVPAGWVAALDYLLQTLYFTGHTTQEEIGLRHSVSTSTVGLRFRELVEALNVKLFDHPARKRLLAQRTLAVEAGRMSEAEFHQRLLRGDLLLSV